MRKVRVSAKAVIIEDNQLLVMEHNGDDGIYYILPGGGQRNGEDLVSTIKRECFEEAGIEISVGDVLYLRDYIEGNHEFAGHKPGFHQVEIMFSCRMLDQNVLGGGEKMDERQIGTAWLPMNSLKQYALYPAVLKEVITDAENKRIYLGDVN